MLIVQTIGVQQVLWCLHKTDTQHIVGYQEASSQPTYREGIGLALVRDEACLVSHFGDTW